MVDIIALFHGNWSTFGYAEVMPLVISWTDQSLIKASRIASKGASGDAFLWPKTDKTAEIFGLCTMLPSSDMGAAEIKIAN